MKKVLYLSVLVITLFLILPSNIQARTYDISYEVTNMNVSEDKITFKGWAIYTNQNNIGGYSTIISIVAKDSHGNTIRKYNGGGSGTNQSAYYGESPYNAANGRNLYLGKCWRVPITGDGRKCVPEAYAACWKTKSLGDQEYRTCIYRQVDFNISFSIEELKAKFNNSEITFDIHVAHNDSCVVDRTQSNYAYLKDDGIRLYNASKKDRQYSNFGLKCNNSPNAFTDSSKSLGVFKNRVTQNNVTKKGETVKVDTNGVKYEVSGISSKAYTNASRNHVQTSNGTRYTGTNDQVFFTGRPITLLDDWGPIPNTSYQVDLYHVMQNGINNDAWSLGSWLITNGWIKLTIGEVKKEPEPHNSCTTTVRQANSSSCNWNGNQAGSKSSTSTKYEQNTCKTYQTKVYFPSENGYVGVCAREGYYDAVKNGVGYFESMLTTDVIFSQVGTINYYLSPYSIHSGGATSFAIKYDNTISWQYTNGGISYDSFYDCEAVCCGLYCSSTCPRRYTVTSEQAKRRSYGGILNKDQKSVENGEEIVETFAANDYDQDYLKSLNAASQIRVPNGDIEGQWSGTNATINNKRWKDNQKLISYYTYDIYDAYIDKESGEVNYTSNETQMYADKSANSSYLYRPKNYFIPLDAKTGVYTFEFSISDLSTMRGGSSDLFKWTNTYSCGVNCVQRFYDEDDNGYYFKYRPIDLNDVFPNRNAGVQWSTWMENEGASKVNSNTGNLVLDQPNDKNLNLRANITSGMMETIRKYNNNHEHLGGYLDKSIKLDGKSEEFLKNTVGFEVKGGNYRLGCGSLNSLKAGCNN